MKTEKHAKQHRFNFFKKALNVSVEYFLDLLYFLSNQSILEKKPVYLRKRLAASKKSFQISRKGTLK